ncbi:MAG: hypothetical protein GY711_32345 [bacterium]|nr:hypothetical protein [bacterium]
MWIQNRLALALALGSTSLAQTSPGAPVLKLDQAWESVGGEARELDVGDFDGDGYPDLAQLSGDQVQIMLGTASTGAVYSGLTATAMVVVDEPATGVDALLVATGDALVQLDFDGTSWSTTVLAVSAAWDDVLLLRRRPQEGQRDQVVGLASDATTVMSLVDSGLGYQELATLVSAPETVLDLEVFDREGDGTSELCLMDADGVRVALVTNPGIGVVSELWTIGDSYQWPGVAARDVAAGSQNMGGNEWMAILVRAPNGTTEGVFFLSDAGLSEPNILPAELYVVQLTAGDWTGDGPDDLALSWRATQEIGIVPNIGVALPVLDTAALEVHPISGTPSSSAFNSHAEPLFGDLDVDGDLDLAVTCQTSGELRVVLNQLENAGDFAPSSFADASTGSPVSLSQGPLRASVDICGPARWPVGTPASVELEVSGWYMPAGSVILQQLPTFSIPGIDPNAASGAPFPVTSYPALAPSESLDSGSHFVVADFYFFRTRFVARNAVGVVTFTTPHQTYGYHAQGRSEVGAGLVAQQQLRAWGGTSAFQVLKEVPDGADDYVLVGGGLVMPKLPQRPVITLGS